MAYWGHKTTILDELWFKCQIGFFWFRSYSVTVMKVRYDSGKRCSWMCVESRGENRE